MTRCSAVDALARHPSGRTLEPAVGRSVLSPYLPKDVRHRPRSAVQDILVCCSEVRNVLRRVGEHPVREGVRIDRQKDSGGLPWRVTSAGRPSRSTWSTISPGRRWSSWMP